MADSEDPSSIPKRPGGGPAHDGMIDAASPTERFTPNEGLDCPPTDLGGMNPGELFARALDSVKMSNAGTGAWQPPTVEEASRLFPGYEVLRLLGRGGMGAVYQARQVELDRLVAIKLLPLEISVDKEFASRFRREARAMAKLDHPNIIAVHDFGTTREGHLFFVMAYVEGANLYDFTHQGKGGHASGLDGAQALAIVDQICTALAYAHGKGIVHRDIKPANVMVDTEGNVKVADFGLARLIDTAATDLGHTMTGTVMGTPDYIAPEQTRSMNVDHRADIYSVGVTLYEMLCGEVPKGVFQPPSLRTGCDTRLDEIVIKAMQQAPEHRYQTTQELKTAVQTARVAVTNEMRAVAIAPPRVLKPVSLPLRALSGTGKRRRLLATAALVILTIASSAFYFARPKLARSAAAPRVSGQSPPATVGHPLTEPYPQSAKWKPLFTAAEWQTSWRENAQKAREFKDRLLHLQNIAVLGAQPFPDGALRARIQWREGSLRPRIMVRSYFQRDGQYKLGVAGDAQTIILEFAKADSSHGEILAQFRRPNPLRPGDTLVLELKVEGDHLTGTVDGSSTIDAHDARLKNSGDWGVAADDAWFQEVEWQSLRDLTDGSYPQRAKWTDATSELRKRYVGDGLEADGEWLRATLNKTFARHFAVVPPCRISGRETQRHEWFPHRPRRGENTMSETPGGHFTARTELVGRRSAVARESVIGRSEGMSFTGVVENDVIKLPPDVHLPDGTEVTIEPAPKLQTLTTRFAKLVGIRKVLPPDLALNLDHYVHGQPRQA